MRTRSQLPLVASRLLVCVGVSCTSYYQSGPALCTQRSNSSLTSCGLTAPPRAGVGVVCAKCAVLRPSGHGAPSAIPVATTLPSCGRDSADGHVSAGRVSAGQSLRSRRSSGRRTRLLLPTATKATRRMRKTAQQIDLVHRRRQARHREEDGAGRCRAHAGAGSSCRGGSSDIPRSGRPSVHRGGPLEPRCIRGTTADQKQPLHQG